MISVQIRQQDVVEQGSCLGRISCCEARFCFDHCDVLAWAAATEEAASDSDVVKHLDSNGALLEAGDTVTLIKDLNVKGSSMVAKRGTAVRNITLVHDNPEHIEGRVNGTRIVLLTCFLKKSN